MVRKFDYWFAAAADNRRIHLYLPADYDSSSERYAVLYMFDGHNLFYDSDATFGKSLGLKEFLDGWWKRLIVVGIECAHDDGTRVREYNPLDIDSSIYGHINGCGQHTFGWIVNDLKPFIDSHYRTWPQREATAIAGYSMGGMMALYGVLWHNSVFSKAAVIPPAFRPAMGIFSSAIPELPISADTRVFLSWGTQELADEHDLEERIRKVEALIMARGARTYLYRNEGGIHNETSWQREVPCWMKFLWED